MELGGDRHSIPRCQPARDRGHQPERPDAERHTCRRQGWVDSLAPALLYSDSRAAEEAAELEARFGREVLEAKALNWKGAVSVLPKLLWLQKHTPQTVANATAIVLAAHDYLYLQLTGGHVTDRTNASTTGLLTR